MSEGEARALLEDCLRVLWYRDTRAFNRIQLAKVRQCTSCVPAALNVHRYGEGTIDWMRM